MLDYWSQYVLTTMKDEALPMSIDMMARSDERTKTAIDGNLKAAGGAGGDAGGRR